MHTGRLDLVHESSRTEAGYPGEGGIWHAAPACVMLSASLAFPTGKDKGREKALWSIHPHLQPLFHLLFTGLRTHSLSYLGKYVRSVYDYLSGDICVCSRRWAGGLGLGSRVVEKVPDEDRVIVGATDDLELIKLESENSSWMLLKKQKQKLLNYSKSKGHIFSNKHVKRSRW